MLMMIERGLSIDHTTIYHWDIGLALRIHQHQLLLFIGDKYAFQFAVMF